jgi:hypothetical protein
MRGILYAVLVLAGCEEKRSTPKPAPVAATPVVRRAPPLPAYPLPTDPSRTSRAAMSSCGRSPKLGTPPMGGTPRRQHSKTSSPRAKPTAAKPRTRSRSHARMHCLPNRSNRRRARSQSPSCRRACKQRSMRSINTWRSVMRRIPTSTVRASSARALRGNGARTTSRSNGCRRFCALTATIRGRICREPVARSAHAPRAYR